MFKFLKSPDRLFSIAMWAVSLLIAMFLIGLGEKILADLPMATHTPTLQDFTDATAENAATASIDQAQVQQVALAKQLATARTRLQGLENVYAHTQTTHQTWLAARQATASSSTSVQQDSELLRRTRELEVAAAPVGQARAEVDALQVRALQARQAEADARQALSRLRDSAGPVFEAASRAHELKVFLLRLAVTLPLIAMSAWLVAKKRRSSYWPLARGFVMFSLVAFFFELVPYLPSYGGYTRFGVGILLCVVGAHYGIRAMQRFLEKRQEQAVRTEKDRRASLDVERAIAQMNSGLCPGCERPIPGTGAASGQPGGAPAPVNHCVYCGLTLFDTCSGSDAQGIACRVRKNAFYPHCPTCGSPTAIRAQDHPER